MNVILDNQNNVVTLQCDNQEFRTIRHLYKVYGNNFLRNYLQRFIEQRRQQRFDKRAQDIGAGFNSATPEIQAQVSQLLNVTIDDE